MLDLSEADADNCSMQVQGIVQNSVIVREAGPVLPDGTQVAESVSPACEDQEQISPARRVQLPLVHCDRPGSVHLTSERIAEMLDAEDAVARH